MASGAPCAHLKPGAGHPSTLMLPFVERALKRGVRRAGLLSGSPIAEGAPGLQPSWFMQNFAVPHHHHAASLQREGRLVTATGQGRVSFIDARDIAEVAVRALADSRSHDTVHVITGPQALSYDDIADILTQVTGRPVRHQSVSPDEAQRHIGGIGNAGCRCQVPRPPGGDDTEWRGGPRDANRVTRDRPRTPDLRVLRPGARRALALSVPFSM